MKWISFAPWANISCWRPTCKTLCLVVDVKSKVIRMVDPGPICRGGPTLEYTWFTEFRGDHFEAELAKYADMPACSTILWWARAYYDQSFHITRMLQLMIVISSTYVPNKGRTQCRRLPALCGVWGRVIFKPQVLPTQMCRGWGSNPGPSGYRR